MTKHLERGIRFLRLRPAAWGIVLAGVLLTPQALIAAIWPGFRGPTGLGYTTEENLPITWGGPAHENVRWSSPLRGQGHASPITDPKGHLFFANAGKSYVVQAGPECRILAVNDLGDGNHPSPAAADGKLFFVGVKNVYCVGAEASQ